KRRDTPLRHNQRVVEELPLPIGEWVDVPRGEKDFWARIRMPYTALGAIGKAVFKANAVYLSLQSRDLTVRFRVTPAVLTSPFPLTRFSIDVESLAESLQFKPVKEPITRIRLHPESPRLYGQSSFQLLEETVSQITFAPNTEATFRSQFHLVSPSDIANISIGSIDVVHDDRNVGTLPDEQHPLQTDGELSLEGWLADRPDGRPFDHVYGVIDGKLFRATAVARTDVGAYYNNPALDLSGFRLQINALQVKKGIKRIDLIGVVDPDQALYRLNFPVWVDFR